MSRYLWRLCLCWLFLTPVLAGATEPYRSLRFDHLSVGQGLVTPSVETIAQDSQGYLWFGGQGGLSRYDGYRVRQFKHHDDDPHSLSSDLVFVVHVDRRDRLWVGTADGLHLYDRQGERFHRIALPKSEDRDAQIEINAILDDGDGGLWVGTTSGLYRYSPHSGKFSVFVHDSAHPSSLASNWVSSLAREETGGLWVANDRGVDYLADGAKAFRHHAMDSADHPDRKHNIVRTLLIDRKHTLWIGTTVGLEAWTLGGQQPQRRRFGAAEGVGRVAIMGLHEDRDGNTWVAVRNGGLLRWDAANGRFLTYTHRASDPSSIIDDQVETVFQDSSGSLWVGTFSSGASHVDLASGGFRTDGENIAQHGLSSSKICGLADAGQGRLWVGTYGQGLNLFDPVSGQAQVFRRQAGRPDGLDNDAITMLASAKGGHLWLGTDSGFGLYDPATGRYAKVYSPPDIRQFGFERNGTMWVASSNGLFRYEPDSRTLRVFHHIPGQPDSLAHNAVNPIVEDRDGTLWVGTQDGLDRFDRATERFTHLRHDKSSHGSLAGNVVNAIHLDAKGNLWIGTDAGLSKLLHLADGAIRFQNYPTATAVSHIQSDAAGRIWFSTDAGISRFDPISTRMKHFTVRDGLPEAPYMNGCGYRDVHGRLYFSGTHGMVSFDPDAIVDNPFPPAVLLTDLQILNQSVRPGTTPEGVVLDVPIQDARELTMSYQATVFSIEFAALHFADPARNLFKYRLVGFDPDWVSTDATKRFATYTNLDPGRYRFEVIAANKDGVWNDVGAALTIIITPPWWKTWWAKVALVTLSLFCATMCWRFRLHELTRQKKLLEQEVATRTTETVQQAALVEQQRNELAHNNQALLLANARQEEHKHELTRFLAVASHDLRQPMCALNLYLGALGHFDMPAPARLVLGSVAKCARTMDQMFLTLLDLSRLDAHVVHPTIGRFALASLLSRLALEFSPQAQAKQIAFLVDNCEAWIESDAELLEQMLRNLCANAVRYTPSGQVSIVCHADGQQVRIDVCDTGVGIAAEDQASVFAEFSQLGNPGRDSSKGLGLGLAIVQRLGRLLNVPIALASQVGVGSTFSLTVPQVAPQDAVAPERLATGCVSGFLRERHIMVIDDDERILDAMHALLEQWGCKVTLAASYAAAMTISRQLDSAPDALICDYQLGTDKHGIDLVAAMREEFNLDIPALLVTGDTAPERIQTILASGMPVLHKPVQADGLRTALLHLLQPGA